MKYDGEKNVWTVVASFPQYIQQFRCTAQCRDWIFVSALDVPVEAFDKRGSGFKLMVGNALRALSYLQQPWRFECH
jgi:hypothetical protein